MTTQMQPPASEALRNAHPQVAEALQQMQQFQTVLEGASHQMWNQTFTGTDETNTVEVTIDGQQMLTDLHLEDGVLRLGGEEVQERVNEALQNAHAAATATIADQQAELFTNLAEITSALKTGMGLD